MIYGITGNIQKEKLWKPVASLVAWLVAHNISFYLNEEVASGLAERNLVDRSLCERYSLEDIAASVELILSFGGDGTMLQTAHEIGKRDIPILGVNIGRLGFLTGIEEGQVQSVILRLERGEFRTEKRMLLQADIRNSKGIETDWALNEFVFERSGSAGLITIHASVDDTHLNEYWADGLIVATPTGSTAYSLSVGGPIVAPGSAVIILTPIAPHSLTVRPFVLPATSTIRIRVDSARHPYVVACDGISRLVQGEELDYSIRTAQHAISLVKLPEDHYFQTLRSKLMWGVLGHN